MGLFGGEMHKFYLTLRKVKLSRYFIYRNYINSNEILKYKK